MVYFWFILGTAVGSFLNVCISRLPKGESIIFPSSHCPKCKHKLAWFDLIPILSYFLLRGRCRYCQASISFRYPLVEFLTGVGFVGAFWLHQGPGWGSLINQGLTMVFISVLIILFFVDLEHQLVPEGVCVLGMFAGLIYHYLEGREAMLSAVWGLLLGYFLLLSIGFLGELWFKKEALGEGDLYVASLLGAFLGWSGVLLSLFLAYLLAAGWVIWLLLLKKVKLGQYVPFAPALALGGVITLFWGDKIVGWYLGLFF